MNYRTYLPHLFIGYINFAFKEVAMGCYCCRDSKVPRLPDCSSQRQARSNSPEASVAKEDTKQSPPPQQSFLHEPKPESFKASLSRSSVQLEVTKEAHFSSNSHSRRGSWSLEGATSEVLLREIRTLTQGLEHCYELGSEREGQLVRAEQTQTKKKCWVQIFPLRGQGRVKDRRQHLAVLRSLDHPHVLRMLDLLKDNVHYYAIYEATEGGNAAQLCASTGGVSEQWAALIMKQVFSAVSHCHSKGLVLKSLNLSRILFVETPTEQRTSVQLLVPLEDEPSSELPLVAPVARDQGEANDIFSCGAVLSQLLIGKPLPMRHEKFSQELRNCYLKWESMSAQVKEFTFSMMAKDYRQRPTLAKCLLHQWLPVSSAIPPLTPVLRKALRNMAAVRTPSSLKRAFLKLIFNLVVTFQDLKEAREAFEELDTDMDGYVSETELRTQLYRLFPEAQAQAALTAITATSGCSDDQKLFYSEFLLWASYPLLLSSSHLIGVFRLLDRENDGLVTGRELREVMRLHIDETFDPHPWKMLIADINHSTEGSFVYSDFARYMNSQ